MGFFSDIYASVKKKQADMKDSRRFLNEADEAAKPMRREAYMKQMFKEVVSEGIEKAKAESEIRKAKIKAESEAKITKIKEKKESRGSGSSFAPSDPYKYLGGGQ